MPKTTAHNVHIAVVAELPTGDRALFSALVAEGDAFGLERAAARATYLATKHDCPVRVDVTPCLIQAAVGPTETAVRFTPEAA